MHINIQWAEADATEANIVVRSRGINTSITILADAIKGSAAVDVAANAWWRFRELLELVVAQVGGHVAQAHDLAAEVALGRACAIGELVGGQA